MNMPLVFLHGGHAKIANWRDHVAIEKPEPYTNDEGDKVWLCDQCGDEIPWLPDNCDCAQIHCEACGYTVCFECNGDMCAWICERCGRAACESCADIPEIGRSFEEHRGGLMCGDCWK